MDMIVNDNAEIKEIVKQANTINCGALLFNNIIPADKKATNVNNEIDTTLLVALPPAIQASIRLNMRLVNSEKERDPIYIDNFASPAGISPLTVC